jgi:hypothetical protein
VHAAAFVEQDKDTFVLFDKVRMRIWLGALEFNLNRFRLQFTISKHKRSSWKGRLMRTAIIALFSTIAFQVSAAPLDVAVAPTSPVVITANGTNKDTGGVLAGPWISFNLSMSNTSAHPITVVALKSEVTTPGGSYTEFSQSVDPSVVIQPGTTASIRVYMDDLGYTSNYTYSVNLYLEGWIGDQSNPTDRLENAVVSFVTQ